MVSRVGISGAGYVAPFHIRGWRAAGVEVAAIADPDRDRAADRAREFGIKAIHASLDEMLEAGGIDALDVAAPRQVHVAQARAGLAAGLPVLCQKPVSPSLDEAEGLLADLRAEDRLMVHENWRFRPEYRRLAQWVAAGEIGPVRYALFTMRTSALLPDEKGVRPAFRRQPFFASEQRMVMAEVLIHNLDVARMLCGPLALDDARSWRGDPELPGETRAALSLTGPDGGWIAVTGDMTAPGAPPGAADQVEICGEAGRATYAAGILELHRRDSTTERVDLTGKDALQDCFSAAIAHFVERCRSGVAFETPLEDNIKTLRLIEAAYEMASQAQ